MNKFLLKSVIFIIFMNFCVSVFADSQKSVALIKSFTGNVVIKYNNNDVKPSKYLSIFSNTIINLGDDSNITLIMKNGDSVFFNVKSSFSIIDNGLVGLDRNTETYIKKNIVSNIYSDAKNDLKGKNIAASRTVFDLPEEMQNELNEASSIIDPSIKSLVKIDICKKYLVDAVKNNDKKNEERIISIIKKELKNYENLKK